MPFKKIQFKKKQEHVISEILEAIKSGEYKVGDKLPSEFNLSETFRVSRPSVREALSALRLVGVIGTKDGSGTYIRSNVFDLDNDGDLISTKSILDQDTNTFEILEARKIVEAAVGKFALVNIDRKNIAVIRAHLKKMEEAANDSDFLEYHAANKKFHYAIVAVTNNTPLINFIKSLLNVFTESDFGVELRRRYLTDENYIWRSLENHRAILESLETKDAGRLEKAFFEHYDHLEHQLLGLWPSKR